MWSYKCIVVVLWKWLTNKLQVRSSGTNVSFYFGTFNMKYRLQLLTMYGSSAVTRVISAPYHRQIVVNVNYRNSCISLSHFSFHISHKIVPVKNNRRKACPAKKQVVSKNRMKVSAAGNRNKQPPRMRFGSARYT